VRERTLAIIFDGLRAGSARQHRVADLS